MKKNNFSYLPLLLFISSFLIHCTDPISVPPDIPEETLLSAPDTLNVENQDIILSTYLWRDFQPVSFANGKTLVALVYIETADSSIISLSINPDAVYIVDNNRVWKSFLSAEERPSSELKPFRIAKIAHDGPKWGPDIYVDVIVRIIAGGKDYLLKASKQYIGRTD